MQATTNKKRLLSRHVRASSSLLISISDVSSNPTQDISIAFDKRLFTLIANRGKGIYSLRRNDPSGKLTRGCLDIRSK